MLGTVAGVWLPVEVGVATSPFLNAIRSISLFGLSDVKVQFTYAFTYDEAQQCGNYDA